MLEKMGENSHLTLYRAASTTSGAEVELILLRPEAFEGQRDGEAPAWSRPWDQLSRARAINHPNVAGIRGMGETPEGLRYVALEVLHGELLSEVLNTRHALPLEEAVDLILQAASGLEAAHQVCLLHGSLSPSSILVSRVDNRPLVKLIRFGLERHGTAPPAGDRATADYSAPERLAGHRGDERSDIFSLAAVLHHLLTGEPPNAEARAAKPIPRAVRSVLSRALETLPTHRFGTVAAFAQALEAASSEEVIRHDRAGRGRPGVVAVGTGLGVVAAAGVWLLTSMDRTQPELAAEGMVSVSGSEPAAQLGESIRGPPVPRKPAPAVSPESGAADPKHRGVSSDDSRSSDASEGQPPVRDELSVTPESIADAEEIAAEEALAAEILEREGTSEPAVPAPRRPELSPSVQAHSEAATGPAEVRHESRERPQPKAVVPEKFGAGAGTPSGDPGRAPRAKTSASADSGLGYAMSDAAEPPSPPGPPLIRTQAMRLAISDVIRLQIAARYAEVKPGVLVLELGAGYGASRSLGYTLERLYNAYQEHLNYPERYPIIELRQDGKKIGEYSRDGLQMGVPPSWSRR